uniref:PiggyBac transposable element-derived protein 1-like n=1 Tax=Saccoglossus kowalevskii TaxID=10224 RepID=A0ABM0N015_SACKO|nr:PREDICTED: piggyBac transposable element-derived protein 1-like [Saccoglossus kowalevskii]
MTNDDNTDEDRAENDDFLEQRYPPVLDSDIEIESDTEIGATFDYVASGTGEWRMATEEDCDIFTIPVFEHEPGPTFELPSYAQLIELASTETNKYAKYHQKYIAKKLNARWHNTNFTEMQAFFGVMICMGVDHKSAIDDYWSRDPFLQNMGIASVMTWARFQMLKRYFHLADPVNDPRRDHDIERRRQLSEADPLYIINPWLKPVLENCRRYYQMGQEISIDEGMVRFKGRSMFKQRLPHKPDRDGFKIWQVCDSTTSYIANFEPYLGVKYKTTNDGRKKETGIAERLYGI